MWPLSIFRLSKWERGQGIPAFGRIVGYKPWCRTGHDLTSPKPSHLNHLHRSSDICSSRSYASIRAVQLYPSTKSLKMADPKDSAIDPDTAPDDDQFNRITLSSVLKTQLMQEITESTDSLPTWQQRRGGFDELESEDENARSADATAATGKKNTGTSDAKQVPRDDPLIGADLTAEKTVTQADDDADSEKKRPSALRRLTTRIRKTISGAPGKDGKSHS
jgi:hypothetical protein